MLRRANTSYEDGKYSLPAGHLNGNETPRIAAIREVQEEIGVAITPDNLIFNLVTHRIEDKEYIDLFFSAREWHSEPRNCEPNKCDDLSWFPLGNLPQNAIPYIREAIEKILGGIHYAEMGSRAKR